jgi:hypothetical protein
VAVEAINHYGVGRHQIANDNNIRQFGAAYVAECLQNAMPHFALFRESVARRILMRLSAK